MYWLRERIHITWHVSAIALGFVGGAALALVVALSPTVAAVGGVLLCSVALWRRRRMLIILAFIGGSLLGLARGVDVRGDLAQYRQFYGKMATIEGVIADDVTVVDRGVRISLRSVTINNTPLSGMVFATVQGAERTQRSDKIAIRAMVDVGFGAYTATATGDMVRVERPVPGDVPLHMRDGFAESIRQSISEPSASLGIGYLLGQKSALPNDLIEAMKIAGLTHIVVASGYNLTILVRIGRRLFARVSKYLAMITGVIMIVGFIAMTGLSPSMTRAGLVAGLGLWAWYYGRTFHPITLLGIAAAATVAVNPAYVWGD